MNFRQRWNDARYYGTNWVGRLGIVVLSFLSPLGFFRWFRPDCNFFLNYTMGFVGVLISIGILAIATVIVVAIIAFIIDEDWDDVMDNWLDLISTTYSFIINLIF